MNKTEAVQLLQQAATMIACDFEARCKLIEAVKYIETLVEPTPATEPLTPELPFPCPPSSSTS